MFEAIDHRQWARLPGYFTPDVVYERPGYDAIRGIDALLHFYRQARGIAEGEHQIWHIVGGAEAAASWGRFLGKSREGAALDERFADVYTIRDGRVVTRATHFFRSAI